MLYILFLNYNYIYDMICMLLTVFHETDQEIQMKPSWMFQTTRNTLGESELCDYTWCHLVVHEYRIQEDHTGVTFPSITQV